VFGVWMPTALFVVLGWSKPLVDALGLGFVSLGASGIVTLREASFLVVAVDARVALGRLFRRTLLLFSFVFPHGCGRAVLSVSHEGRDGGQGSVCHVGGFDPFKFFHPFT
jgi:hypothetical protein